MAYYVKTRRSQPPDYTGNFSVSFSGGEGNDAPNAQLVWVPVISICKIFILSYLFDGLLCQNWPFSTAWLYR
jgi:hypothetical protein